MTDTCPHHSGIEAELKAICAKMDLRFEASEKEVRLAREDMERRLEGMNEFRSQLSAQAGTFISRTEMRLEIEKLINRIVLLEKSINFETGSHSWSDKLILAVISALIAGIVAFVMVHGK